MKHPGLQHEIRKVRPFDVPEQEAYLNLARTHAQLSGEFDRLFRQAGLSEATYNALRILRGAAHEGPGRRSCREIGDQMVAQVPDVTRLIDRLAAQGLAERDRSTDDRRVVYVKITQKGLDLLAQLDQPVMDMHRQQLHHLTRQDLDELNRLLVKARHRDGADTHMNGRV